MYLDHEYAFSVNIIDAVRLKKGQTLTPADIARLKADDDVKRAVETAARFLSNRPRSTEEVRRNLADKAIDEPIITVAIERLQRMGYLDDEAFARYWVENRTAFKPLGAQALRYELRQKGISDALITQVLADLDPVEDAYRAAQKRVGRFQGQDRATFRAKMTSFLQRRGFDYGTINDVINRLMDDLDEQFEDSGEDDT